MTAKISLDDWDDKPISPSVGRMARLDRYVEPYCGPHAPGKRWHGDIKRDDRAVGTDDQIS